MNTPLTDEFTIQDDFPPVDYEQWRQVVEESLRGAPFEKKLVTHTYEGIDVQPVYSRRDAPAGRDPFGFPGLPPFVRGAQPLGATATGWDLRQEYTHPDIRAANEAILEDVGGGATSVLLRLDATARNGQVPGEGATANADCDGVLAFSVDDLDAVMDGVDLSTTGVALDAGAAFAPAAAMLAGLWQRRGVDGDGPAGAFLADPLGALARNGQLPLPIDSMLDLLVDLARWTAGSLPRVTAVGVDTTAYHDAGATAAQDLGFAMGTAVAYLRAMCDGGLDIDTAARQILFRIGLGTHHFLAIAKLRAARRLWSRVVEASGGSPAAGGMQIHTRTSNRALTQRDPYVNLLRNTVAAFAAGIGGADVVTSVPFDAMVGLPDTFSRRVARNTVLVLREEAHLHRVIDPAGGSWFLDRLTEQLAEKAWETLQELERRGGILAALESGWVAAQIDAGYAPRAKDIARRKVGITGVSEFPDISEKPVAPPPLDPAALRAAAAARLAAQRTADAAGELAATDDRLASLVQAAASGANLAELARACGFEGSAYNLIPPLEPRSFAEPFEELRDASDAWQAAHGRRPRVFLANMGPIAQHSARAMYAKNFFEAGGFEVIGNDGFGAAESATAAFSESGARIAVICSSDPLYQEFVPALAPQLKAAGARSVIVAGAPGENAEPWQAAGVDRFIFIKCDVLATLRELLQEEGVWPPHGD